MPRHPGPMCISKVGLSWIDGGTNARTRNLPPGPIGSSAGPERTIRLPVDVSGRLLLAAQCGLPLLPSDAKQRLAPLLTYEAMAVLAGSVISIGAAHAVGVGFAADILVGAVVIATIGQDAIDAARHGKNFYSLAISATSEKDFERAGREFASFVTIVGINTLLVLLLRARPAPRISQAAVMGEKTSAAWMAYISKINFKVPAGKGILWSQFGAAQAEALARSKGLVSLEMLLKDEGFLELYAKQFGSSQSKLTGDIWRAVSQRYAASLEGKVTAFVHEKRLAGEIIKRAEPILKPGERGVNPVLIDEMEEIAEAMISNNKISSVEMIDLSSGKSWLMLREQVLRAAESAL